MIKTLLTPLSWLYGLGILLRNLLYDVGIRRVYRPEVPVVVVGNITVGGTGKTPFVILLTSILLNKYQIAILSRGYKRRSKGFRWVSIHDDPVMTGDEPLEIKRRLPQVQVAVDRNRRHGIETILAGESKVDLIIMDDGFQHRSVQPDFALVLADYDRPVEDDRLLPAGRLREPLSALQRAHALMITRHPEPESKMDDETLRKKLKIHPDILLMKSGVRYLYAIDHEGQAHDLEEMLNPASYRVILIAGIANPSHLVNFVQDGVGMHDRWFFHDHHHYRRNDFTKLDAIVASEKRKVIVLTTGKDAVKIRRLTPALPCPVFEIRIEPVLDEESTNTLIKKIIQHVHIGR